MDTGYLNFCPRCGRQDLDREEHGSPGTALCNACGTLFSILSVRFGERMIVIAGGKDKTSTKVSTSAAGPIPEEPSAETTLPLAEPSVDSTLRIDKKRDD